jgi:hypothetical protein
MLRGRMIPRKGTGRWNRCAAALLALSVIIVGGCKRRSAATPLAATMSPSSPPPASTAPAPQSIEPQVPLSIDGAPVAFPAVHLRATATGGGLAVRLTTPSADEESDNSLFFDLLLDDVDAPENLPGASWHFRSDDDDDPERADTLNGIFLYGHQAALEPRDVTISFATENGSTLVEIDGRFCLFDPPDSEAQQKKVSVKGRFPVPAK